MKNRFVEQLRKEDAENKEASKCLGADKVPLIFHNDFILVAPIGSEFNGIRLPGSFVFAIVIKDELHHYRVADIIICPIDEESKMVINNIDYYIISRGTIIAKLDKNADTNTKFSFPPISRQEEF